MSRSHSELHSARCTPLHEVTNFFHSPAAGRLKYVQHESARITEIDINNKINSFVTCGIKPHLLSPPETTQATNLESWKDAFVFCKKLTGLERNSNSSSAYHYWTGGIHRLEDLLTSWKTGSHCSLEPMASERPITTPSELMPRYFPYPDFKAILRQQKRKKP